MRQSRGVSMPTIDPDTLLAEGWSAHPEFDALYRRMKILVKDSAKPYKRDLNRFIEPKWSGEADRLSGLGAKQYGQRWNPMGLAALYGAESAELAFNESIGRAQRAGFLPIQLTPRLIFAFRVKLAAILELTHGPTRTRLRVSKTRMVKCDWQRSRKASHGKHREQLTQAIGRAAAAAGFEAIRVPSTRAEGANLVVYPEFVRKNSKIQTLHADDIKG